VTDPTRSGLREISTPQLYRRNAFRITGLPTDADRRTVRQRRQRITTLLEVGADVDLGHGLPVDPQEVAQAFDLILGDPRRRLVDELFWLWDTEDATCACSRNLHRDHDAAVRAHSSALDLEEVADKLSGEQLRKLDNAWSQAARQWARQLRRAAFWDHVRHRISALDDKQLDESAVDLLRGELPTVLVKPLIQLAGAAQGRQDQLSRHARDWPVPAGVVGDLLERAAEPLYAQIEADLAQATGQLRDGPPQAPAGLLDRTVGPRLARLDTLVPADQHRRTARVRNDVAVLYNNCATKLIDELGPDAGLSARTWLASARKLATDPTTIATIGQNDAMLTEIVAAFEVIRDRVAQFTALGRRDLAQRYLRDIRRRMVGAPGVDEIDRMLADLGGRAPGVRPAPSARRPSRRRLSRLVWLLVWALVLYGAYRLLFGGGGGEDPVGVRVFAATMADNAPAGTCIADRAGWQGDKASVPSVPCDREHWGEILGYVPLGGPSAYPGDDAVRQQAGYLCAWRRAEQGLEDKAYVVESLYPDREAWDTGGRTVDNYITCLLRRADDRALPEHRLVDPGRAPTGDGAVTLSMFQADLSLNPPVGSCIADQASYDKDRNQVSFAPCERHHWGEIVGYPVLYPPGTPWPGDKAVYAAADAACRKVNAARKWDASYYYHVTWPAQQVFTGSPGQRKYAACTISRADGKPLIGHLP
jgi:putative regulator of septum formation